ncbi:MAG: AI-2E family transporter [Nakamurella sp.]
MTQKDAIEGPQQPTTSRIPGAGYGLPRVLIIILGLAAGVVVVAGMRAIPGIIGPIFTALVLTITVNPIRGWLIRRGASKAVASLAVFLTVLIIVVALFVAAIVGVIQLATLMPQYADQIQQELSGLQSWLAGLGVTQADIQSLLSSISPSQIAAFAAGLLSSVSAVSSFVLLMVGVLIFLAVDAVVFDERMEKVRAGRSPVLNALDVFAKGTRKYFGVATVFGGIVAVIDGVALLILGIPAAGLWALLAFVTNYIPNIGFIIGLIPPVVLGLLVGGPSLAITVLVVYCVVNFIIQSVLQPKFVGDAVGLTTTVSFLSLIVWAYILGPIGAILAIPASLFFKALLVDMDPDAEWLELFLGDKPVFKDKAVKQKQAKALAKSNSAASGSGTADRPAGEQPAPPNTDRVEGQ